MYVVYRHNNTGRAQNSKRFNAFEFLAALIQLLFNIYTNI